MIGRTARMRGASNKFCGLACHLRKWKMKGVVDNDWIREAVSPVFNASASMGITLALPGHRFTVVALDGNPVPTQTAVDVLWLDVAERADVIVEMNNPGVWVFGSTDDMDRQMGLGIVIEYENRSGEPQWVAPPKTDWDYTIFGRSGPVAEPDETIRLKFEKIPGGRGATTAGQSTANHGPTRTHSLLFRRASGTD
jgi:multicopper oxidase